MTSAAISVVGAWKLISFQVERSDGHITHPFGEDAIGAITYSESGRFTAQIMRRGRPQLAAGDPAQGTPEEIKSNHEGIVSYFGLYDFDAANSVITHNVEGAWFPNFEGQALKRFFELSGDRLRLSTLPLKFGGSEVVGTVVWERA